jgi:hypothetical protein
VVSYLATIGAFIIVAALAVDPFSQQILQYYSCYIAAPDLTASIPRNNNFTADTIDSQLFGWSRLALDETMAGSIWLGVIQPPQNLSSQINVQCPSGNCTFSADSGATYDTIAMCSSCNDISDRILNYTLPRSSAWPDESMTLDRGVSFRSGNVATSPDLFSFESIMLSKTDLSCNDTKGTCETKAFATRCSLIPCVQSYKAEIRTFILNEQLVSTTNMIYDADMDPIRMSFSLVTNSTTRNGVRHDCITSKGKTTENTVALSSNNTIVNSYNDYNLRNTTHWTSPYCFFQYDSTAQATADFLRNMFANKTLSYLTYSNAVGDRSHSAGDLWIERFYNKGTANLTTSNEYMKGLAIAISAQMRRGHDASQDAIGTVLEQQRCVHIEWAWIALPASLVLMSILFLAATMWASLTQAWHGMWKSSSLALIFAFLESESLLHSGTLDKKSHMANSANTIEVQFMKTERGWGFVEQ